MLKKWQKILQKIYRILSKLKTKIFCDSAEIKLIKKFNKKNIVKGFTTNPTLMRKATQRAISLIQKNSKYLSK